MREGMMLIVAK